MNVWWLLVPIPIYVAIFVLHLLIPARRVTGYVQDSQGNALTYRLNGLIVFLSSIFLWALACQQEFLQWNDLYLHRFEMASGACVLGLLFSLWVVLRAPKIEGWSFLKEYFLGRTHNPQWLGAKVDAKMFLYLLGAIVLELNLLSFAAHHYLQFQTAASTGVFLHVALFTFFLTEYLFFEEVHLYTYDFVAENVGFKLGWGCFVFYPFYYSIGLWNLADAPNPQSSVGYLILCAFIFFSGWMLSRGANLQKYWFKKNSAHVAFGILKPEMLEAENGKKVLVSGFWGLSRHINYLGEILMATGLALSLGYPAHWAPWMYPLYYVALLVPRQFDDDKRCFEKYGTMWSEYKKRVPFRIVPFVF
jgi:hypothetical protein